MDQGQSGGARATGSLRLSRLPKIMHRASHDNLRLSLASRDPVKASSLPQPARPSTLSQLATPTPLGENLNRSTRGCYGWSSKLRNQARSTSPVRDALQAAQALDTTPPSSASTLVIHEDGNENDMTDGKESLPIREAASPSPKRKPRLSLSERTVETLSRVSPSPSPTRRRRSSIVTHDGLMGPPLRPASRMKQDEDADRSVRSPSPKKQTFRPPGSMSPTREPRLPTITSPGSIYTPPRAFVKGGSARFSRSTTVTEDPEHPTKKRSLYSSKTLNAKTTPSVASAKPSRPGSKSSLMSLFEPPTVPKSDATDPKNEIQARRPATTPKASASSKSTVSQKQSSRAPPKSPVATPVERSADAKSSATLRQTIAQAKAAKRSERVQKPTIANAGSQALRVDSSPLDASGASEPSSASLQGRLRQAVVSGSLNLSAMNLLQVPQEVMDMYESTKVSVSWSEMVDLSKADFSGNQLTQISDEVFPDWSVKELQEDEDKTNQFAGLEILFLQHNKLTSIPIGLRRMERLRVLNLSGNDFSLTNQVLTIIWQIPHLQSLSLAKSGLKGSINLSTMATEQLQVLDLSDNELTEIELAEGQMSGLQKLHVSSNRLVTMPWRALAKCSLLELRAASNKLSGIALPVSSSGYARLRDLDLSHNEFVELGSQISGLVSLQSCTFTGNGLQQLPDLSALANLTTLLAGSNKLQEIPESITSVHSLKHADFSNNNITTLRPEIALMNELTSLNLEGNPLRQRNVLSMTTADLKAHMQKRLKSDAARPPKGEADSALPSSDASATHTSSSTFNAVNGVLDLSNRGLKAIKADSILLDSDAKPIHTLKLSNNDLKALPYELLHHPAISGSLRSLDVSHNPNLHSTEYLTYQIDLPALQALYIISTGLTSLEALTKNLKAPELVELNISCHRISGSVPNIRDHFPKCITLLASDNWFSSISAESIRGLEVVDVRNNQIEGLPADIGLLGNHGGRCEVGRLRNFEVSGNPFRVPRIAVIEKGTEAILKDLRRRVPTTEVPDEWKEEI